jgi:DNA-binding Lrp family transcriptional regulator
MNRFKMVDAHIIIEKDNQTFYSPVKIFYDSSAAKVLSNEISWKIIQAVQKKPKYAREIARELSLNEQSIYYHIKRLIKSGIIDVVETQSIRGATAKKIGLSEDGAAIMFREPKEELSLRHHFSEKLSPFFNEFLKEEMFNGYIVVGSPEPHGPFRSVARDGHYVAQLTYFLGQFSSYPENFIVRLDTDVKAEKLYGENLLLMGGPITNIITYDINKYLPVKFIEPNYWSGLVDQEGRIYNGESDALIAKIRNPYNNNKCIVVLAGIRYIGTKSAIIGLTERSQQTLRTYDRQSQYVVVIRGYDQDGDGKIDHVETLKSYDTL